MKRDCSRSCIRRWTDATGSTIVEAALITPLLVVLTLSIVDFAGIFYVHLALENGVSEATRYGITGQVMTDPSGSAMSREDSIKTAMREATPTLTLGDGAFSFSHKSPGAGGWIAGAGGPNDIDKVTVNYTWQLMTPILWPFFPNHEIALQVESAMKNEGRFQ
jgi:Flp pilus assembly protein TadG